MKQKTLEAGLPQTGSAAHEPRPMGHALPYPQNAAAPRVKVSDGKAIAFDHPAPVAGETPLMAALGAADRDFCSGLVVQLGDAASYGDKVDEQELNFMLSVVKGIKPRDEVETMLASQMAAVHVATLASARRLARANTLVQRDCAERALSKLARTFAAQTEALKRYRSGGEPNVTVRHVSVSEGGQAIVGSVTQTRRDTAPPATPATPASATPTGAAASRGARARATAPKPLSISTSAPAEAPMTAPHRSEIVPAPRRRAR
jgi:hypothetical protein